MVKRLELHPFQHAWLNWGAVTVFIAVLILVLAITLADPVIRLIRLELKYLGRQQEVLLEAKHEGLESDKIKAAMATRAEQEADQLAANILGGYLPSAPQQPGRAIGFTERQGEHGPVWMQTPDGITQVGPPSPGWTGPMGPPRPKSTPDPKA
jgi:hypothetical protein